MYDIYSNNSVFIGQQQVGPGIFLPIYADLKGNKDISLLGINMLEIGYRVKATNNLHFDLDLFRQESTNYSALINQPLVFSMVDIRNPQTVENISLKAEQLGATLAANFVTKKIQIKPFVTIQQTRINDMPVYRNAIGADSVKNISLTYDSLSKSSPSVYGGVYLNCQISPRFTANLNGYLMSNYTYINVLNSLNPAIGRTEVFGKIILNAKVSYKVFDKLDLFVNVRNLSNSKSYEFAITDITNTMFLVGGNFEF
jgi:hypothetical protein